MVVGKGFQLEEIDQVENSDSASLVQLSLLWKKLRGEGCFLELGGLLVHKCCGMVETVVVGGVRLCLCEKVKHWLWLWWQRE